MQSISGSTPSLSLQDSLNLLTTQLRNQDPLQPTDDTQFVNQIAQLNQTQQISRMADSVDAMSGSVRVSEATSLIGKTVDLSDGTSGTVTAVTIQSGLPRIVVNGHEVALDAIASVR
jgi:flagellar basal-body rod modification protein FlgD